MSNPKDLLDDHGIYPKKSLGQNFLHDPNAILRIVESAELPVDATVIEVGPGTGVMTAVLAESSGHVIAIETDDRLLPILENQVGDYDNVEIIHADFLKVDLEALVGDEPYYVVANLPYYITSAIIRKLLDHSNRPQRLILTVQREVADRIMEAPGDMSVLSVSVQFYGKPELVTRLNPAVFWPRPDVESAVIRVDVYDEPVVVVGDTRNFFKVVRAGFSQKRKQLKNSLRNGLQIKNTAAGQLLERAGIDPKRRAETLSLDEWGALTRTYESMFASE
jgi:16S rRNA (adenine1518-N6/adenine1519-N6)-dimethyltransferase